MVCNSLDIRRKIRMWVSIHDRFVSNLGITKCLNQYDYPWIIHRTLPFILCACISSWDTKFCLSSINYNIVVKVILQTRPRWTHEREVMLTILPYRPLTCLQHPNRIEYRENSCVLPADIPYTEIHIFPWLITHSVWTLATQQSLSRSQIYRVLQIQNAAPILCNAVTSNPRTFTHNDYV